MPTYSPNAGAVHVSRLNTQFSIAYIQNAKAFIAGQVFPSVPVDKQTDRFVSYPKGAFMRSQMKKRAPGARATLADYTVDNTNSYFCDTYALAKVIPDESTVNQDAPIINNERDTTNFLTLQALIQREKEFVATYFKAGVWTHNKTGVAATPTGQQFLQFNDTASTPIKTIRAWCTEMALNSGGFRPNTMTLGRNVYDAFLDHPEIIDRIKYGQTPGAPAMVNRQTLAALFEVDRVLVCDAVENTAIEGATDVFAFIANKGLMLTYAPETPSRLMPSAGYVFPWVGFLPGQGGNIGEVISRFRPNDGSRADFLQIDAAYAMKLIAADMGLYAATAVA